MDFSEALVKYQQKKAIKYEPASRKYVWEVNRFRQFIQKELSEITIDDIVAYQAHLKKDKSDNTQAIAAQALRGFFGYTLKKELTKIDPKDIDVPRIIGKVPVYVVQSEFETLCDIAKYQSPLMHLAIRMLWFTAVRVSELCDIEVAQVDLIEKCAKINTRKAFMPKQVFWDDDTNDLLKGIIKHSTSQYLFSSPKGGKISTRQIERWVEDLVKKAGIKKHITPHSFRHGATKEWLNNKVDLPAIKELLGHKHLMSVEKYTKRLDDDIRDIGREAVRSRSAALKYNLTKIFKDN